jgi:selenide,water dikinase
VWRRPDGRALVATADFFTPIVDDARTWGRIAAANAASDVYAMGGTPLFALNLTVWPRERLPLEVLGDVLAGGADVAADGGWVVAGGHTVDGEEPMYGQAVVGEVDAEAILSNAGARAGEALVLTKPLGTGLVATMVKRCDPVAIAPGGDRAAAYEAAVAQMTRLNDVAARVALASEASAATDVTGFGLLGHLQKLALASGVSAHLDLEAVPVLPGAWALLDAGYVPGGTQRNLAFVREHVRADGSVTDRELTLLSDAQTSGGLLFTCPEAAAEDAVSELRRTGHVAARVGRLGDGRAGSVRVA